MRLPFEPTKKQLAKSAAVDAATARQAAERDERVAARLTRGQDAAAAWINDRLTEEDYR